MQGIPRAVGPRVCVRWLAAFMPSAAYGHAAMCGYCAITWVCRYRFWSIAGVAMWSQMVGVAFIEGLFMNSRWLSMLARLVVGW
jgi:hypothetical protein